MSNTTHISGTVAVVSGSTTVTGTGSIWTAAGIREGDLFCAKGLSVRILEVVSATELTLADPWPGENLPEGSSYEIRLVDDGVRALNALNDVLTKINLVEENVTDAQAAADAARDYASSIEDAAQTAATQSAAAIAARNEAETFRNDTFAKTAEADTHRAAAAASEAAAANSAAEANQRASDAEDARDQAAASAVAAASSAAEALSHANDAASERADAEAAADAAAAEATAAANSATEAAASADDAAASETAAAASAAAAANSAAEALSHKQAAEQAVSDAEAQVTLAAAQVSAAADQVALASGHKDDAAASASAAAASAAAAQTARNETEDMLDAIAVGPVASVAGLGGIVSKNDLITALDIPTNQTFTTFQQSVENTLDALQEDLSNDLGVINSTLATKADAASVYNKGEIDQMFEENNSAGLAQSFVAYGEIQAGQFVALRADGKVEVVSGTETSLEVGEPTRFTVAETARFIIRGAVYNEPSSKLFVLWCERGTATGSFYMAVGEVNGSEITFGERITVATPTDNVAEAIMAVNSDGTLVYVGNLGNSFYYSSRIGRVVGTTITWGSVYTETPQYTMGHTVYFDEALTSIVGFETIGSGTPRYFRHIYDEATLHLGTKTTTTASSSSDISRIVTYDPVSKMMVNAVYNGTDTFLEPVYFGSTTPTKYPTTTVANSAIIGAHVHPGGRFFLLFTDKHDSAFGSLKACTINEFDGGGATLSYMTRTQYSVGNALAFNPIGGRVQFAYDASLDRYIVVYDAISGRQYASSDHEVNMCLVEVEVGDWSGPIFSEPTVIYSRGVATPTLPFFLHPAGQEVALLPDDPTDAGLKHVVITKKIGGMWQVVHDERILNYNSFHGGVNNDGPGTLFVQGGWTLFDIGNWNRPEPGNPNRATQMDIRAIVLPTETTNAHAYLGIAMEDGEDGDEVDICVSGITAYPAGGLTVGVDYYLAANGSLTIRPTSGRYVGKALGSNVLFLTSNGNGSGRTFNVAPYVQTLQDIFDQSYEEMSDLIDTGTLTVQGLVSQAEGHKAEAQDARDIALAAKADTLAAKAIVESISTGPVISINGRSGVIDGIATLEDVKKAEPRIATLMKFF